MDNLTLKFLANAASILKKAKNSEDIGSVINQLRFKSLDFSECAPNDLSPFEVCKHCGNMWHDGLFSMIVKCHKNNKIRKQIRKLDLVTKLSPCRKDYMSFYKTQRDNVLIKKCLVCKSNKKISMNKPLTITDSKNVDSQNVELLNSTSKKRKRKSGKKQSFAGLSPSAVLQARLSSCHNNVVKRDALCYDVSKICEQSDVKNLSMSKVVKNNLLLSQNAQKSEILVLSSNIPPTVLKSDLSLGVHPGNVKKKKFKKNAKTGNTENLSKKKNTFLSEVRSIL